LVKTLDDVSVLQTRLAQRDREVARLRAALEEKELLLAELGHRAGNNLQAIIALIRIVARTIADPRIRRRVDDLGERVAKIGVIQRLLSDAAQSRGAAAHFLGELAVAAWATYGADHVAIETAIEPIRLKPSAAVALGLLLNEAVSNSFKHAFAATEQPRIVIGFQRMGTKARLVVQDNGSGPGPGRDGSMGVQLMQTLARQLRGDLALEEDHGTRLLVTIPMAALTSPGPARAEPSGRLTSLGPPISPGATR